MQGIGRLWYTTSSHEESGGDPKIARLTPRTNSLIYKADLLGDTELAQPTQTIKCTR